MVADLLFRVACHGGGDEPLGVHLKRITDSAYTRKTLGGADIEGELIAPVVAESHDEDCRREIMRHVHECLSAKGSRHWQKIYGGLALTDILVVHGSPALLAEVAQGFHFDLVQKVSLLESFDAKSSASSDRRAQSAVQKKAAELRSMLVSQLELASKDRLLMGTCIDGKDTASTCSSGLLSTATPSTSASSSRGSPSSTNSSLAPRANSRDLHIDDSFAELADWMHSKGSNPSSLCSSPSSTSQDSVFSLDDGEWDQLETLPPALPSISFLQDAPFQRTSTSLKDVEEVEMEEFFTPMPAPATARSPMRGTSLLSL